MNVVTLIGRITKEPELKRLSEGRVQTSFVLAITRNFKNLKGEIESDFVLCTVWGKLAENTVKYCGKGSLIGINGRIQSRSFEREDGQRVFVTEVVGEELRFLATKPREAQKNSKTKPPSESAKVAEGFYLPEKEKDAVLV